MRLEALVLATALGAARLAPVIWMVPALGGTRLPAPVRVGFAAALALLAAPALAGAGDAARLTSALLPAVRVALLLAREVIVGLCLALVASGPFRAAEIAGRLSDALRGANIAEVIAPTSDERASPLAALHVLVATLLFLQLGGLEQVLAALMSSYQAVPLGGGFSPAQATHAGRAVVAASAALIASGLALAAPVVVALWLADVALGLVARAAPQIPVYFVGLPLKGLLAVGVVFLGLGAVPALIARDCAGWLALLSRTIGAFLR
jgi:flagellar biosynthetic protein FliR